MNFLPLAWQIPAIFTAVPMVARLLPFKLALRAVPLFYTVISLLVMTMPDRIAMAMAAAGLVTLLHHRVGVSVTDGEPPDMREVSAKLRRAYATTVYLLSSAYDWLAVQAGRLSGMEQTIHGGPDDVNPEDGVPGKDYSEPPPAPPEAVPKHIPDL